MAEGHGSRRRHDLVLVDTNVGLLASNCDARESVAALEAFDGHVGAEVRRVGAGRTLLAAVVGVGLLNSGDGQRGLGDGQVAIDNLEGNVKVAVLVGEHAHGEAHVLSADIRTGHVGVAVQLVVTGLDVTSNLVQVIGSRGRVAGNEVVLTVINMGLVVARNGDGNRERIDGQVALNVADHVVVRNASRRRDNLVRIGTGVGLRTGERDARKHVVLEQAFDGHVGVKALGIGASGALGGAVVGVGLLIRRNRQRERVVDRDDVAFDLDRSRRCGIIAVVNQALRLILGSRADRDRVCASADCHGAVVSDHDGRANYRRTGVSFLDGSGGAKQVMVYRVVSLVQLEVRVVGMRLIEAITVLGRDERCCFANMLGTIVNSPVVEDVGLRGSRGGRAGRSSGVNLHGLRIARYQAHSFLALGHRIVDSDLLLLPDSIEILIGILFVSSNLSSCVTVVCISARVVPSNPGRGCGSALRPSLERISSTSGNILALAKAIDVHSSIDLDGLVLAISIGGPVVLIPIDVRRGSLFGVLVDSLQLDGVGVLPTFLNILSSDICLRGSILNPRVALQNSEGPACGDSGLSINVSSAIPSLKHPVVEYLSRRSSRRCASGHE